MSTRARVGAVGVVASLLATLTLGLGACGGAVQPGGGATQAGGGASAMPPETRAIAAMHLSKCGSCHTRPEPRTRTREHLEDALSRHRKRVRMTADEWARMIDYLAMPAQTAQAAEQDR
jgi:hypothetical protein